DPACARLDAAAAVRLRGNPAAWCPADLVVRVLGWPLGSRVWPGRAILPGRPAVLRRRLSVRRDRPGARAVVHRVSPEGSADCRRVATGPDDRSDHFPWLLRPGHRRPAEVALLTGVPRRT